MRLRDLRDCVLSLGCHPGCERPVMLRLGAIARSSDRLQLRAIIGRLRCSRCKRRPARVVIMDHVADGALPTWRVELMP
jgi:hypothetical protein